MKQQCHSCVDKTPATSLPGEKRSCEVQESKQKPELGCKELSSQDPEAVGFVHIINCHKPKTVIDFQGEIEMFLLVDYNVHLRISFTECCLSTTAGVHSFYSADLKGETSREQSK